MSLSDYRISDIFSRKYIDRPFWILFAILIIVAIIALFSAGSTLAYDAGTSAGSPILKQIVFIIIGVAMAFLVQYILQKSTKENLII